MLCMIFWGAALHAPRIIISSVVVGHAVHDILRADGHCSSQADSPISVLHCRIFFSGRVGEYGLQPKRDFGFGSWCIASDAPGYGEIGLWPNGRSCTQDLVYVTHARPMVHSSASRAFNSRLKQVRLNLRTCPMDCLNVTLRQFDR